MATTKDIALLPEVQLTLTANASTVGTYTRLRADSTDDAQYPAINIGPGETVILGPFNKARRYRVVSKTGEIKAEKAFKGVDGVTTESVVAALSAADLELVAPTNNDQVLIKDSSDDGKLKAVTVQSLVDLIGASSSSSISEPINQTAHGLSVLDVIRLNSSGSYQKAIADSSQNAEVIGIVTEVLDSDNFTVTTFGKVAGFVGLVPGDVYFLSETIPGAITATPPSLFIEGNVIKPLLVAESATTAHFKNYVGQNID